MRQLARSNLIVVLSRHLHSHGSRDTHGTAAVASESQVLERSLAGVVGVGLGEHCSALGVVVPHTRRPLSTHEARSGLRSGGQRQRGGRGRGGGCRDRERGRHRGDSGAGGRAMEQSIGLVKYTYMLLTIKTYKYLPRYHVVD